MPPIGEVDALGECVVIRWKKRWTFLTDFEDIKLMEKRKEKKWKGREEGAREKQKEREKEKEREVGRK